MIVATGAIPSCRQLCINKAAHHNSIPYVTIF